MPAPRTHRQNLYVAHNRTNLAAVVLVVTLIALVGWVVYGAVADASQRVSCPTHRSCPR